MLRLLNAITPTIDSGKWDTCFPFERRESLLIYLQAVLGVRIIARVRTLFRRVAPSTTLADLERQGIPKSVFL